MNVRKSFGVKDLLFFCLSNFIPFLDARRRRRRHRYWCAAVIADLSPLYICVGLAFYIKIVYKHSAREHAITIKRQYFPMAISICFFYARFSSFFFSQPLSLAYAFDSSSFFAPSLIRFVRFHSFSSSFFGFACCFIVAL